MVFGHQRPDTDAITSAIVLSNLKNKLGMDTEPRSLGDINNETAFVLDYFKMEAPKYLNDVHLRVKDVDYLKDCFLHEKDSIFKAYNYMNETKIGTMPVVDDKGKFKGVVSMKDVAGNLISSELGYLNTSYDNLLEALNGKEILRFDREIKGNIVAASYRSTTFKEKVKIDKETVLIVGDRHSIIEYAVLNSASIIILTNGIQMKKEHLEIAKKNNVDVISTEYDGLKTANLVVLSNYIKDKMITDGIEYVCEDDTVTQSLEIAKKMKFSNYPVVNYDGKCLGVFKVNAAENKHPKRVMLVDHNEIEQSVAGLEEAEIMEIVDHHKIGNVGTRMPINFRNMPLGCTETVLYLMYKESNVDITKDIAGLMMAGIISDTLLLTSPTTTDTDRKVLKEVAEIAGIDYEKFAMDMFKAGSSIEGKSITEVIHGDFKNFTMGGQRVGIGQVSSMNPEEVMAKKDEFVQGLNTLAKDEDYAAICLFVTDIMKNGSYLIYNEQSKELFSSSFGIKNIPQGHFFEGLVSRKKQMVPKIMNYMERKN